MRMPTDFSKAVDRAVAARERVRQPFGDQVVRRFAGPRHATGDRHVRGRQRDPAERGDAVVRQAEVPAPRVRAGHAQRGHRPTAERPDRVDRLAGRDAGEAPAGPGPEVPGPLGDHRDVRAERDPRAQQAGVDGDCLDVAAED
jgi:hypothetical protein